MNPINNKDTLSRMIDNNSTLTILRISLHNAPFAITRHLSFGHFVPNNSAELKLLGNAIAKSRHLERIEFHHDESWSHAVLVGNIGASFLKGIRLNSSIHDVRWIRCNHSRGFNGARVLKALSFRQNANLTKITFKECNLGDGGDDLASAIQMCKSVRYISITESELVDEILVKLVRAVKTLDHLKVCVLSKNDICRQGCEALATLLQRSNCSLITLCLSENNINDNSVAVLANALKINKTLKKLYLDNNPGITDSGWNAFIQVLSYSNHTLTSMGEYFDNANNGTCPLPQNLTSMLALNRGMDKQRIAIQKVLLCYPHLDMEPFLEWDLKLFPVIVGWFDRANGCMEAAAGMDTRKLDAIYQFTQALPMMFVKPLPSKSLSISGMWMSMIVAILSVLVYLARQQGQGDWYSIIR
mmetsp:Transcript_25803/g.44050  ORF Transcript_25803/g.44050 Transcript_25803/m.44050 type:complete len:415 (+) Transcript_25803:93-1337(+)|eukprot:CAMPEP_0183735900 /NCGR_PEP_ID=MMETSP0737-20130205/47909_1 /TAXON_ID=385413 /ORGANISM="Thalassiosira miniscula, Strain CCMP1093" /LENGTH=414 /DNA_ID=CAMNT_0025969769 /DNA_START=55 /DNA_END=1299 /DNA_ORIENTATION=-